MDAKGRINSICHRSISFIADRQDRLRSTEQNETVQMRQNEKDKEIAKNLYQGLSSIGLKKHGKGFTYLSDPAVKLLS